MKKRWIAICLLWVFALAGCAKSANNTESTESINTTETGLQATEAVLKAIEPVGQVPEDFREVMENNAFYDAVAFKDRLLKTQLLSQDEENRTVTARVSMMDLYGKELASYTCTTHDAYHVCTLTATEDGGFLFVLGFRDYAYDQQTWASDNGFASRVIKCDKDGQVQFDTPLDKVEGEALRHCFERDGRFYFFGTGQTPETKNDGIYSPTDIYMTVLDREGAVLDTQYIAGSDYDSLYGAEPIENGFLLSVSAQSDDGDFEGSGSGGYPCGWMFKVNMQLEITEKTIANGRDYFDRRVGETDGDAVYMSNIRFWGFDAGTVTAFVDYGDFYLVVSEHNTGVYDKTPLYISSIWYYTETVYSAYADGELIFRAAVDSSPDYDAMVTAMQQ